MATLDELRESYYKDSSMGDAELLSYMYLRDIAPNPDYKDKTFEDFASALKVDSTTKGKALSITYDMVGEGVPVKAALQFTGDDRDYTGEFLWNQYKKTQQNQESRMPLGLYADQLGLSTEQFSTLLEKAEKEGVNITAMTTAEEEVKQAEGRPDLPYAQRPELSSDVDRTPIKQQVTSMLRSFQDRLLGGFGADAQAFIQTGVDRLLDADRATDNSILEAINQLGQEGEQFSGKDIRQRAVQITKDKTFAEESEENRREYLKDIKEYREDIGFVQNTIEELAFNPLARIGAGQGKRAQAAGAVVYGAAQGLGQSEEDRLTASGTTAALTGVLAASLPLLTKPISVIGEQVVRTPLFQRVLTNLKQVVNNDPNITKEQLTRYTYKWFDDVREQAKGLKLNKGVVDSLVKELDSLWSGRTLDKGAAASLEKIRPKKTNISVLEKELDSVISRNKMASKTVTKQDKAVPLTESEIARAKAKQRAISTSLEREATELGFSKADVQGAVLKLNERGDFDFVNHISGKDLAGIKKNLFRQRFQSEVNLNDILELRKSLPDFDTQQRQVAAQSIEAVDNWLNSLKPEQVSGKFLKETLNKFRTSNTAYQQLKKNNDVLGVIASSKGDALAMKSGFQRLLTEAKKRGGYSKQELSALEDLTKTAPINLAIIGFNSSVQKGMSKTWALLQAASILTVGKLNISPLALGGIATGLGYGAAGLNKYITNLVTKSTISQKASMYARLMRSGQLDNYRALIPDMVSTLEKAWRMSRPAIVNDLNEMEAQENVQGMLGL
jgi:hypothetical protein